MDFIEDSVRICNRCRNEEALPRQAWGRACFAAYRRQERAERRKTRGVTAPPRDHSSEATQGAGNGQEKVEVEIPTLMVKIHPHNFLLRFPGGRLHPEDVPILAKLRLRAYYRGYIWTIQPEETHR